MRKIKLQSTKGGWDISGQELTRKTEQKLSMPAESDQ